MISKTGSSSSSSPQKRARLRNFRSTETNGGICHIQSGGPLLKKIGQATAILYHAVSCHIHVLLLPPTPASVTLKAEDVKSEASWRFGRFFIGLNLEFKQQNSIQNESNVGEILFQSILLNPGYMFFLA